MKTKTFSIRFAPAVERGLKRLAARDRRTKAEVVRILIEDAVKKMAEQPMT